MELPLVFRSVVSVCLAALFCGSPPIGAQEGGDTQLEVIHASGSVYMLQAPGGLGNMGVF